MASASTPLTNVGNGYTIVTQVIPSSTAPTSGEQTLSPLQKFLKGEPKALGTVQIVIGLMVILLSIVVAVTPLAISVFSGILFWGSLLHISAGSLAVSASNKLNSCVVKAALVLNILSMIASGIAIITLSLGLLIRPPYGYYYYQDNDIVSFGRGITGVLLVFSILQFIVSITISTFTCKATCTNEPNLNIINMVPNPEGYAPVANSFPDHQVQPGVSTLNAVSISSPPVESPPPAYCEKGHPYH